MLNMSDVYIAKILSNTLIADGVFSIIIACKDLAAQSRSGQFLHIKCGHSRLLRRPISICSVHSDVIRFVFEVKGEGTKWLSIRKPGDTLDILGPLGKGFEFPDGDIIVVGGGIGTPPMLCAAHSASGNVSAILGFRSRDNVILKDEFEAACRDVIITTDDGSVGIQGTVIKPLEWLLAEGKHSAVMSCGPFVMQKAVATLCKQYGTSCQVSLEERMGCGVGACLVCACATVKDGNSDMSRVCADGPVFNAEDIRWI